MEYLDSVNCFQDTAFRVSSEQYDASFIFEDILRVIGSKAAFQRSEMISVVHTTQSFHEQHGILVQELVTQHRTANSTNSACGRNNGFDLSHLTRDTAGHRRPKIWPGWRISGLIAALEL